MSTMGGGLNGSVHHRHPGGVVGCFVNEVVGAMGRPLKLSAVEQERMWELRAGGGR